MKKYLLILIVCIQYTSLQAQLVSSSYHWYRLYKTFSANTAGASVLASGNTIGDALYSSQPIGFSFNFNGTDYSNIGISSNGFIWFGATNPSATEHQPVSSAAACDGIVSVFGANLHSMDNSSALSTQVTGTAPDRILTIEWKKFGVQTSMGDYQVKLYEDSDFIEFHYNHAPYFIDDLFTGQVGLRGAASTDFNNKEVICSGGINWEAPQPGATNTASCTIDGVTNCSLFPHTSTTYRWSTYTLHYLEINGVEQLTTDSKLFSITNTPGSRSFEITLRNQARHAEVKVLDCIGRQVYKMQINEPGNTFPLTLGTCERGIYFVQISSGMAISTKKIIIE